MKTIEITVAPDGSVRLQTHGFVGRDCQEASRFLRQTLGKAVGETKTAEFFQTNTTQAQQARQH
ncbi:DUF2997 domain-containing protein [Crateriforma conspicua]|uniref:DUF2997 domain-containing protein n=1 Tax=Crateriforma conspicua TaxID=2527996 RepID=A0A5C6FMK3_9PLAN|nr:DUF2997 domain-containing protein [Crateriforma conspicua]TWU62514.1 hypothetical protein V7x_42490 [Crateriforma conspicua]